MAKSRKKYVADIKHNRFVLKSYLRGMTPHTKKNGKAFKTSKGNKITYFSEPGTAWTHKTISSKSPKGRFVTIVSTRTLKIAEPKKR